MVRDLRMYAHIPIVLVLLPSIVARENTCPFWNDAVFVDGKCLKFFSCSKTWPRAKAACEAKGPNVRLAEVTTEGVRAHVMQDVARARRLGVVGAWVGATDEVTEGTFIWTSGNVANIDDTWWALKQPDNNRGNEDCLMMTLYRGFNDFYCGYRLPYFCEATNVEPANDITPVVEANNTLHGDL